MKIISGNSHPLLAKQLSDALGIPLTAITTQRFPDQETFVEIHEKVADEDVFVLQSTSHPANDNLMELLMIIDALKQNTARSITAIIPYFGYARQDQQTEPGTPLSAKLVATLLQAAGVERLLTCDLHSDRVEGFFDIPVNNLSMTPFFAQEIQHCFQNPLIISPDGGGIARAQALATHLKADLAIIEKHRHGPGHTEVITIKGAVAGRTCLIIDDIIDSGNTLCQAALALLQKDAQAVHAFITHGVLSGSAHEQLRLAPLTSLVITDTIDTYDKAALCSQLRTISVVPLLADCVRRINLTTP
ncbi:MAG: ribose-phosphate pyrophosphokinase [Alphaproteobacteria bacterium]